MDKFLHFNFLFIFTWKVADVLKSTDLSVTRVVLDRVNCILEMI